MTSLDEFTDMMNAMGPKWAGQSPDLIYECLRSTYTSWLIKAEDKESVEAVEIRGLLKMLDAEMQRTDDERATLTPLYSWKGGGLRLSVVAVAERALLPGAGEWVGNFEAMDANTDTATDGAWDQN